MSRAWASDKLLYHWDFCSKRWYVNTFPLLVELGLLLLKPENLLTDPFAFDKHAGFSPTSCSPSVIRAPISD